MAPRPLLVRLGWTLRDYAKRVWDNSGEDNVLFLAGGIAFNILLAVVPFFLLLVTGATYVLRLNLSTSGERISGIFDTLLPLHQEGPGSPVHKLLTDVL